MSRSIPKLQRIDNNDAITIETHQDFLLHLQRSLLLALQDRGMLSISQYRHAVDVLNQRK